MEYQDNGHSPQEVDQSTIFDLEQEIAEKGADRDLRRQYKRLATQALHMMSINPETSELIGLLGDQASTTNTDALANWITEQFPEEDRPSPPVAEEVIQRLYADVCDDDGISTIH